jgi:aconitate hydratase
MNFLASPPLVVAYALAGHTHWDPNSEPIGYTRNGEPVMLKELWPTAEELKAAMASVKPEHFKRRYENVLQGDPQWQKLNVKTGDTFAWDPKSTYVRKPPFFDGMPKEPKPLADISGASVLALLGDSVTTDHISPAGSIPKDGPAGKYLIAQGVQPADFNSFGARRGNHEVMVRGTLANIRLRNQLAPGTEGGLTRHLPDGEQMFIYDASMKYQKDGVPLLIIAGKEYGSGSSRDWAAKGVLLLGVRAVIAESFERIHRTNLVGMGVLPLQFQPGESAASLNLTGAETYHIEGVATSLNGGGRIVSVRAVKADGTESSFTATVRVDTPQEVEYYRNGGILPYVLRQLAVQ